MYMAACGCVRAQGIPVFPNAVDVVLIASDAFGVFNVCIHKYVHICPWM